jgi:hypothetical protein
MRKKLAELPADGAPNLGISRGDFINAEFSDVSKW